MAAEIPNNGTPEEFGSAFELPDMSLDPVESARPQTLDEIMRAATAVRDRQADERAAVTRFLGGTEEEANPIQKVADRYGAANLLNRLSNPDAEIDIRQTNKDVFADKEIIKLFAADDLEPEEAKVHLEFIRLVNDQTTPEDNEAMAEDFKKQHESIVAVAEEHNCGYSEVVADDGLYYEAVRRFQSAESIADQYTIDNLQQLDDFSDTSTPAEFGGTIKLYLEDLHESQKKLDVEMNRSMGIFLIVRSWGVDGLEGLSDDAKQRLGIDSGLTERHLTRGAPQNGDAETRKANNVLRTSFAKRHLTVKGEDYNNPTSEGMRDLHKQPAWIRPLE